MIQHIDKAVFTADNRLIARKRYNPTLGIALTVAGAALLWANSFLPFFTTHELLSQWNVLLAGILLIVGGTMICYYLFGDSTSARDKASGEQLYRSEYFFEAPELPRLTHAIESGDFTSLEKLPRSYQSAAQVVVYRTDSGSVIAAQALQHHLPVCAVKVFKQGDYTL